MHCDPTGYDMNRRTQGRALQGIRPGAATCSCSSSAASRVLHDFRNRLSDPLHTKLVLSPYWFQSHLLLGTHWHGSRKYCRARPSLGIKWNWCRSTTCHRQRFPDLENLEFCRTRSRKYSRRYYGIT